MYNVEDVLSRHAISKGEKILFYLEQIKQFLEETYNEFLILKIREENPITIEQRDYLVD